MEWLRGITLLCIVQTVVTTVIPNSTHLESLLEKYMDKDEKWWISKQRGKRAITESDMQAILDLHNKLRGQVYPTASNMEYMVWDTELERSAEAWAETCLWEHGPASLLPSIGQNLGAHWGRFRPPTFHIQAWYDEVRDYTYPYSQECDPYCPFRCSGPVCTHYTQVVWATSSRIGCAINLCHNMNVWGQIWPKAIYLVCNYSPKGNWWGHAPYKNGRSCSACPPSYGGGCRDNLCYKAQQVSCETRLRDKCKGTTCNRYECPAGCLDSKAKVIGSVYFEMQISVCQLVYSVESTSTNSYLSDNSGPNVPIPKTSYTLSKKSSVCRTAVHAGVIRNSVGGYIDVMPVDKRKQYVSSYQNGIFSERFSLEFAAFTLPPQTYAD
ncbi:UNVERIFIED_CONTAM: hypothetical protein FKN15_061034 [Acipenser sinensis]